MSPQLSMNRRRLLAGLGSATLTSTAFSQLTAAQSSGTITQDPQALARDVVDQYIQGQVTQNIGQIVGQFDPLGSYIDTGQPEAQGTYQGTDKIREYFTGLYSGYKPLKLYDDGVAAHHRDPSDGDIYWYSWSWTMDGVHSGTNDIVKSATHHRVLIRGNDLIKVMVANGKSVIFGVWNMYPVKVFIDQDKGSGD